MHGLGPGANKVNTTTPMNQMAHLKNLHQPFSLQRFDNTL